MAYASNSSRGLPSRDTAIQQNSIFSDDCSENHNFIEPIQVPVENALTDDKIDEFIDLFFPPDLLSNGDLEDPSMEPRGPSSVYTFRKLVDSNIAPNKEVPEKDSNFDLGARDLVSLNLPISNTERTESHKRHAIDELVTPGAAALRKSNETAKRPRRRKNQVVVHGNNPYGKRGKKSCHPCRKWKTKCEYGSEELPCRLCKSRGWKCGVEDKVLGPKGQRAASETSNISSFSTTGQSVFPIIRLSPVPEEEALTSFDAKLLHQFFEDPLAGFRLGRVIFDWYPWPPRSYPIFSESIRCALLVWASNSFMCTGITSPKENIYRYLHKSYQSLRRSASSCEYREVVLSSYILYRCEDIRNLSAYCGTTFIHCLGMWNAFAAFTGTIPNSIDQDECLEMEIFARCALSREYQRLRTEMDAAHEKTDKLVKLLEATCNMGDWYWDDIYRRNKILQLSTLFQLFSDFYVLLRNSGEGDDPKHHFVRARLEMIVDQVIRLVPKIPEQWVPALAGGYLDTEQTIALLQLWSRSLPTRRSTNMDLTWTRRLATLHYTAVIVKCSLEETPSIDEIDGAISAAFSLITLSANTHKETGQWDLAVSVLTSLFLSGLVLGQSQDSFGLLNPGFVGDIRCRTGENGNRASI